MYSKSSGKFDWVKLLVVLACIGIVVTMLVVPGINFIKSKLPSTETTETAKAFISML